MLRYQRFALWVLALFALLSCKPPPAQILVRIETDIPQGAMGTLRAIRVQLKNPSTSLDFEDRILALDGTGANLRLPGDVAVTLPTDRLGSILDTRVTAMRGQIIGQDELFTVRAVASFPKDDAVVLWIYLANRCLDAANRQCPQGYTCGRYGCEQEVRGTLPTARSDAGPPEASLAPQDGALSMDGSSDASMDASSDASMDASSDASMDASSEASACAMGQTLCGASCVDTRTDRDHCGACGTSCANLPHVSAASCAMGRCLLMACEGNYRDCDNDPSNGCETSVTTTSNCGSCRNVCAAGLMCDGTRSPAVCTSMCSMGTTMCSGSCVDTRADPDNCGGCGTLCADRPNWTRACAAGSCSGSCVAGFADCDSNATNGCEASINVDPGHCGGCAPCPARPNTRPTCSGGLCSYTCLPGFADCDGVMANGCESDLSSTSNCGGCGVRCSGATPVCDAMLGRCIAACTSPLVQCMMSCVDTDTDSNHCGACGNRCTSVANASVGCAAGRCVFTCNGGFDDCDGNRGNGCEANLSSSATHCGACGNTCAAGANATAFCRAGVCDVACASGYRDADGDPSNGCEAFECFNRGSSCMAGGAGVCQQGEIVCMGPNLPTCVPVNVPDGTGCTVPVTMVAGRCSAGMCVALASMDSGTDFMLDASASRCDAGGPCVPSSVCVYGMLVCMAGIQFCQSTGIPVPAGTMCTEMDGATGVCNGAGACVSSLLDASFGP